ncbi:hypothetical protein GCM10009651_35410 [Microbacterium natoriense]|uniref:hypothetical protein n=1 Tax=Microbacterium TaxID=33882 RepID=UPI000CFCC6A6|nr:hypothetical protein [Microbacterium sp. MYb72]PRB05479.1 hypothetical protein CQ047_15755 [Microbacterium sp. MYb72]
MLIFAASAGARTGLWQKLGSATTFGADGYHYSMEAGRSSMSNMGLRQRIQGPVRVVCAAVLIGFALWVTWDSSSYWAPCAGASGKNMNAVCSEAMSSYDMTALLGWWYILAALVVVLVVARVVPLNPMGAIAIAAVLLACPIADSGFSWVQWGSADGVPGQGLWTACWLAVAGLSLAYTSRDRKAREHGNALEGAPAVQPSLRSS